MVGFNNFLMRCMAPHHDEDSGIFSSNGCMISCSSTALGFVVLPNNTSPDGGEGIYVCALRISLGMPPLATVEGPIRAGICGHVG